jgi:hypothetical protein
VGLISAVGVNEGTALVLPPRFLRSNGGRANESRSRVLRNNYRAVTGNPCSSLNKPASSSAKISLLEILL